MLYIFIFTGYTTKICILKKIYMRKELEVEKMWNFVRCFWYNNEPASWEQRRNEVPQARAEYDLIWYNLIRYDTYKLQLGFHPVAVVRELYTDIK